MSLHDAFYWLGVAVVSFAAIAGFGFAFIVVWTFFWGTAGPMLLIGPPHLRGELRFYSRRIKFRVRSLCHEAP